MTFRQKQCPDKKNSIVNIISLKTPSKVTFSLLSGFASDLHRAYEKPGGSNHLKACPLHGIGPAGGRCGSSYIPLHVYSPEYCGVAPARGK